MLFFCGGSVPLTKLSPRVSFPVFPVWVKIAFDTVVLLFFEGLPGQSLTDIGPVFRRSGVGWGKS